MSNTFLKKILLAALSGVMLTASFPPSTMSWMAWFALVPLLISLDNESASNGFRLGFIAGLVHYLTLIYWIINVISAYGGLNLITSSVVLLLLCLYLSLYQGAFAILFIYLKGSIFRVLLTAGSWVSLEFMRAKLLTGFPWCLLGYSQFNSIKLIQTADVVGVYGISFLIVMTNTLIFLLFFHNSLREEKRLFRLEAIILLCFMGLAVLYGDYRLSREKDDPKDKESFRAAIIQGNIDQAIKWDEDYQLETLSIYRRLSKVSYHFKPQIIVWPETAVPFFFQDNPEPAEEIYGIVGESGAHMIFGSPAYEREDGEIRYYNRAYFISPMGTKTYYDKVHLVPFGEYVPLRKLLPFINPLVQASGDFSRGKGIAPLNTKDLSSGPLICYEAIFPELSRSHVKKGAEILVNLTNDSWFGMTSAPYQHLIMSVFRAVENRRPLIRAANTGFSAFIDSYGRITLTGSLFGEEVLMAEIKKADNSLTFYTQYGDIFVYIIFLLCLIKFLPGLCYYLFKKRRG
jgi:apolipoprotein N-acyltransferase